MEKEFQHLCMTFLHSNIYVCLPNESPMSSFTLPDNFCVQNISDFNTQLSGSQVATCCWLFVTVSKVRNVRNVLFYLGMITF